MYGLIVNYHPNSENLIGKKFLGIEEIQYIFKFYLLWHQC